jgi:hypothetical protein
MAIRIVTVVVAVVLAFDALAAYKKEVDEKILEERIKTFDDAIKVAGEIDVARNWDAFGQKLDEFGAINHGQALATLGEGDVYDAINAFYDAASAIWNHDIESPAAVPPEGKLDNALEDMARQFHGVTILSNSKRSMPKTTNKN